MSAVHPDAAVRDAARACEQETQTFVTALCLERPLYDALAAIDASKLDPGPARRFETTTLRDYRRAGVALDEAKRAASRRSTRRPRALGQQIQKNIAEDIRARSR